MLPGVIFLLVSVVNIKIDLLLPGLQGTYAAVDAMSTSLVFYVVIFNAFFKPRCLGMERMRCSCPRLPTSFSKCHVIRVDSLRLASFGDRPRAVRGLIHLVGRRGPSLVTFANSLIDVSIRRVSNFSGILSRLRTPSKVCSIVNGRSCLACTRCLAPRRRGRRQRALRRERQRVK